MVPNGAKNGAMKINGYISPSFRGNEDFLRFDLIVINNSLKKKNDKIDEREIRKYKAGILY